jgi:RNA polymerase sigma-70 factor (ECF subfamily)
MAAVSQVRPSAGEFQSERVRVNGQPGRVLRGPAERQPGKDEQLAADKVLALVNAGELSAEQLIALVRSAREVGDEPMELGASPPHAETHVWSVLTVDVIDGRIQTVRIVRNPDKLGHL